MLLIATAVVATTSVVAAMTPNSPEVKQAIAQGVTYLESDAARDDRVGAQALLGMVLLEHGAAPNHPKIAAAVARIQKALGGHDPSKMDLDIYSTGLSIIFLAELSPTTHRADVECLLKYLAERQKPHGGWGYPGRTTGDTSMTQYGVLGSWEAKQAGFALSLDSIEAVMTWLLRTQDPSGGFGYQGTCSNDFTPVPQSEVRLTMTAAGLGSVNICAIVLGLAKRAERRDDSVPSALKEIMAKDTGQSQVKPKSRINPQLVRERQSQALRWLQANYKVDPSGYTHYWLYALERCMSFQDFIERKIDRGPQWYDDGASYLIKSQAANGSWNSSCGAVPDTAFSVLFLMRSTKKSIEKAYSYGDGTLIGGRGLPKDTSMVEVRGGRVVAKPLLGPAEKLLAALETSEAQDFDGTVDLLADLPADKIEALASRQGEIIRRLVKNQSPEARLAAVRVLGKVRSLDNVEALIYALSDPDPFVVRAANESLLRISRNPTMVSLPEEPTAEDCRSAAEKWKAWYRTIRPNACLE